MSLFDENGKLKDPEALRSIRFSGEGMNLPKPVVKDNKIISPFLNEDTGKIGGVTTKHDSGRVDVNVFAEAAKAEATS